VLSFHLRLLSPLVRRFLGLEPDGNTHLLRDQRGGEIGVKTSKEECILAGRSDLHPKAEERRRFVVRTVRGGHYTNELRGPSRWCPTVTANWNLLFPIQQGQTVVHLEEHLPAGHWGKA
jgi:hypothetical protein